MNRQLLAAVVCLTLAILAGCLHSRAARGTPSDTLAVLGAFDQEVSLLEKTLARCPVP